MNYKNCPHYDELVQILSENRDLEDISFELTEIQNCIDCSKTKGGVCKLWIELSFVENMNPQMDIVEAKLTIDNLGEQIKKIAIKLIKNSTTKNV